MLVMETVKGPNGKLSAKKAEARAAGLRETGRKDQRANQKGGLLKEGIRGEREKKKEK
jgi:hypothetical protein